MNQPLTQQRIRITFGKEGMMRFIGHLDLAKTWERVLRRAEIPLEYTQGFNPRPRMQFAAALPVGVTSETEYLDAWVTQRADEPLLQTWIERLNAVSPTGLRTYALTDVPIKEAALPTQVTRSEYVITPINGEIDPAILRQRAAGLLAAGHIERTRNKKTYDLRPLILDLVMDSEGHLIAHMMTGEKNNARPDELLDALGFNMSQAYIHRRRLYLGDGN
jgi:radical SAM-linked protein